MTNCPNCKTTNPDGTAFCSKCGFQFIQNQPPTKNKSNLKIVFIVLGCLIGSCVLCGLIGGLKEAINPTTNTNAPELSNHPPQMEPPRPVASNKKTEATPVPVSKLTWNDYDRVYNLKSNSTDVQKESLWKTYDGKYVTWTGEVAEVSEGTFSGMTVSIKMNEETLTNDILLTLKDSQKDKIMSLTKGEKITFTGKLKSYGGAVLPLTMDEGEIK